MSEQSYKSSTSVKKHRTPDDPLKKSANPTDRRRSQFVLTHEMVQNILEPAYEKYSSTKNFACKDADEGAHL